MADTVTAIKLYDGPVHVAYHLTCKSDGTGEAVVQKIDKSTLTGPLAGVEPGSLVLEEARWAVQGFTSVELFWDHTTDDKIVEFSGNGYDNWAPVGYLQDPKSAGGTGDVLLTSNGAASGASYDITLLFRKKQ